MTAIVSTHFYNEAEYCDTILLMHDGRIAARGTPSQMKADVGTQIKIFQIETEAHLHELNAVKVLSYVVDLYSWGRNFRITIRYEKEQGQDVLVKDLHSLGLQISAIKEIKPALEDVFIRHYRHD